MSDGMTFRFLGDDAELKKVMKSVSDSMQAMKKQIDDIGHAAKDLFVMGLAGISIASIIKGAEELEEESHRLHDALAANGYQADQWTEHLEHVAEAMSAVTTATKGQLEQMMIFNINHGVSAEKLENLNKMAIGLSRALGISLTQANMGLTRAMEGNFFMFNRSFQALRNAHSDAERMTMLTEKATMGWKEESHALETVEQMQRKVEESLKQLKAELGEALLPSLYRFFENVRIVVSVLREWVSVHKEVVNQIVLWTASLLSAAIFLPRIIGFLTSMGSTLIWLVTNPIGLFIVGMAAVAAAVAFVAGKGDAYFDRIKDGAIKIASYVDIMLGSWINFKDSLFDIWNVISAEFKAGWERSYSWFRGVTDGISTYIQSAWSGVIDYTKTVLTAMGAVGEFISDKIQAALKMVSNHDERAKGIQRQASAMSFVDISNRLAQHKADKKAADENLATSSLASLSQQRRNHTFDPTVINEAENNAALAKEKVDYWQAVENAKLAQLQSTRDAAKGDAKAKENQDRIAKADQAVIDAKNALAKHTEERANPAGGGKPDTLSGNLKDLKKGHINPFIEWYYKVRAKFAALGKDMGGGPDNPGFAGDYKAKDDQHVALESADAMYKRITTAAAGRTPEEKTADNSGKLVSEAEKSNKWLELASTSLKELGDLARKEENKWGAGK